LQEHDREEEGGEGDQQAHGPSMAAARALS
jgi:hypothetical protein